MCRCVSHPQKGCDTPQCYLNSLRNGPNLPFPFPAIRNQANLNSNQAFALIELLVVIGILAVLTSLSFPVFFKVKEKVRAVQCAHHLRQWGLATHLFADDSDGWLPQDGSSNGRSTQAGWYIDLPPYVHFPPYSQWPWRTNHLENPPPSIFLCPSNKKRSDGVNLFHYALNRHVNGSGAGLRIRVDQVRFPSRTIWLFDNGKKAAVASRSNLHTHIHAKGANILLLDGHVEHKKASSWINPSTQQFKITVDDLLWFPHPDSTHFQDGEGNP